MHFAVNTDPTKEFQKLSAGHFKEWPAIKEFENG